MAGAIHGESKADIESHLTQFLQILPTISQQTWNEMFMIDLYPENQEKFGLDLHAIVNQIARETVGR